MFNTKPMTAYILSALIAVLAAAASIGGIAINDLYRDNSLVISAFYGNDLVTLFVAVPVLAVSLVLSASGSRRAQLVWLSMLVFMIYNFAFYLFGAAYNELFLIYVALVALSIFTILILWRSLNPKVIKDRYQTNRFFKLISGYMLLVGLLLGLLHISFALNYIRTGKTPEIVTMVGHPTSLISALDLSLIVPLYVVGAIWLWQRKAWGYLFAIMVAVHGAVYNLALTASVVTEYQAGTVDDLSEIVLWGSIATISLFLSLFLLGNVKPEKAIGQPLRSLDVEAKFGSV